MTAAGMHLSDCTYPETSKCDCGWTESKLASYLPHDFVATAIASTGRFGFFVGDSGSECFIETEQLPASALVAYAAAANLPDPHEVIAIFADPNSMDFYHAREAVVAQFKALTLSQGVTSYRLPHF